MAFISPIFPMLRKPIHSISRPAMCEKPAEKAKKPSPTEIPSTIAPSPPKLGKQYSPEEVETLKRMRALRFNNRKVGFVKCHKSDLDAVVQTIFSHV